MSPLWSEAHSSESGLTAFRLLLREQVGLPHSAITRLLQISEITEFSKGQVLVRGGDRFAKEVFVIVGTIRCFQLDGQGQDRTTAFHPTGGFMSVGPLRCAQGVSLANYQACSSVLAITIDSVAFAESLRDDPYFLQLAKWAKEQELQRQQQREFCLAAPSGAERYRRLLAHMPDIQRTVAQLHISSYLGLTPVSLSRLRRKIRLA